LYEAENANYKTDIIGKDLEVKLSDVIISEQNLDKAYMRVRVNINIIILILKKKQI